MVSVVGVIEMRASEDDHCTVRITCIDSKVPVACVPVERTIEVGCCAERTELPVEKNILEVEVTLIPVCPIQVIVGIYTHEIVEVYFISSLILLISEIKLVSHLVGKEECVLSCLFVTHSIR